MVERFNRSMKEAVQAGCLEGRILRESVDDFVEIYRATPHTATNVIHFEAMHGGRKMKLTLPRIAETDHVVNKERKREYKKKMLNQRRG